MSRVGTRLRLNVLPTRFILLPAAVSGLKSATAADITAPSHIGNVSTQALYIISALSTLIVCMLACLARNLTGPAINLTAAPRAANSSAIAKPIFPDE